jgi:hypothetical protein
MADPHSWCAPSKLIIAAWNLHHVSAGANLAQPRHGVEFVGDPRVVFGVGDAAVAGRIVAKSGIPTVAKPMTLWFDLLAPRQPHYCISQLQYIHFSRPGSKRYNFTHAV